MPISQSGKRIGSFAAVFPDAALRFDCSLAIVIAFQLTR
jgi:hypothetical protein